MSENTNPEGNLADEFVNLGKNMLEAVQAAWQSPERKRMQQEIEEGLNELGSTLKREADQFAASPTGQQLKTDVEELGERIRSGEAQTKLHQEMMTILQTANKELQKVVQKWSADTAQDNPPPENPETEG